MVKKMSHNILVIDDDPDICEIVSMALSKKGFTVKVAMSGEQGITAAREQMPDIVLLDNTLPNMAGKDVAKIIKNMSEGKKVAIVMMSGKDTSKGEIDQSLYSGCLKKPFKLSDMADYVEKISKEPHAAFEMSGTEHYYSPGQRL